MGIEPRLEGMGDNQWIKSQSLKNNPIVFNYIFYLVLIAHKSN